MEWLTIAVKILGAEVWLFILGFGANSKHRHTDSALDLGPLRYRSFINAPPYGSQGIRRTGVDGLWNLESRHEVRILTPGPDKRGENKKAQGGMTTK